MHVHPSHGKSRDVGEAIITMLYPEGTTARIPVISITGTNGKTTVTRMIGHILQSAGMNVGMTTTDAMSIRGTIVARGDLTGSQSARTVLGVPPSTSPCWRRLAAVLFARGWATIGLTSL